MPAAVVPILVSQGAQVMAPTEEAALWAEIKNTWTRRTGASTFVPADFQTFVTTWLNK
jgi:hypothetical protein